MADKKTLAIILGTAIGAAAVATAVSIHMHKCCNNEEPMIRDVNDVFEQARKTVQKLDDALSLLKQSDPEG